MHRAITKAFKNYHIFGFTGTPIFVQNAASGGNPLLRTTEQAFGDKLHTYTIVDAINDDNVLPFRIDFVRPPPEKRETGGRILSMSVPVVFSAPSRNEPSTNLRVSSGFSFSS